MQEEAGIDQGKGAARVGDLGELQQAHDPVDQMKVAAAGWSHDLG